MFCSVLANLCRSDDSTSGISRTDRNAFVVVSMIADDLVVGEAAGVHFQAEVCSTERVIQRLDKRAAC